MKNLTFALLLCLLIPCTMPAAGPDPNAIYIDSITYGGTGCPQGTVGQAITGPRTESFLGFDSYVPSKGPGVPIAESRKDCQINVNLSIPPGGASGTVTVVMRGYVQAVNGGVGGMSITPYFAGNSLTPYSDTISGPFAGNWERRYSFPIAGATPGQVTPVNLKTSIDLLGPSSANQQMTVDYIGLRISQQ